MWKEEKEFSVKLGGNYYINTPKIIVYKGESLFEIKRAENTGLLGIDFEIYDKQGNKLAVVRQGRIYQGDKTAYEVSVGADSYTLTEKSSGRIICDIKKRDKAKPVELDISVSMYTNDGFLIEASPSSTNIGNAMFSGNTFRNCAGAIEIK